MPTERTEQTRPMSPQAFEDMRAEDAAIPEKAIYGGALAPVYRDRHELIAEVDRLKMAVSMVADERNQAYRWIDRLETDVHDLSHHLGRLLGENPSQADRDAAYKRLGELVHRAAKEA